MANPLPGEMSKEEGMRFIESLTQFGRPYPVLIITGGDVLMRPDAFELTAYAKELGIPVGLAPSVTPHLTSENMDKMKSLGVKAVSISLDGATAHTHEGIRGVKGHFEDTIAALKLLADKGFSVQVNTAVMRDNVHELPAIAQILKETGISIWEVFFLIHVGRGHDADELTPKEHEDVAHFLFDASTYGLTVRTVEGPFFRRIVQWRQDKVTGSEDSNSFLTPAQIIKQFDLGSLYLDLSSELQERLGHPTTAPQAQSKSTRDGKGIIFVAHDGTVYPAGFLPTALGNVREKSLASIYRDHPLLQDIRSANFSGRCGVCDYRDACGGSRARAFAASGNALGEDPACAYMPAI